MNKKFYNKNVAGMPETAEELINKYGTYNIQPTCDTENEFPCIAHGATKKELSVDENRNLSTD